MSKKKEEKTLYILDELSPHLIKRWMKQYNKIADYCWDHFSYFAHKRSHKYEDLKDALRSNTRSFEFSNWRRIIDNRFFNNPLSTKGSILHFPGGRFNIGDIDPIKFPRFGGLYLAQDTTTALREKLGLEPQQLIDGLTSEEINIAGNISHFVIKGHLTCVLDIHNHDSLQEFFELINTIHLPTQFITRAAELNIAPMRHVNNVDELVQTFLKPDWNIMPTQFDVPANPQILGQLAYAAGIEAILYPSVKTKKQCLVVYPDNFNNSDAYIELEGDLHDSVKNRKIDHSTYQNFS